MFDAIKNMTGGRSHLVEKQTSELALLIESAREERTAITAMLNALTTSRADLAPLAASLERATGKAAAVTGRLDEIAMRLKSLDDRTQELGEIAARIQALKDATHQAERAAQKAIGPDSELQKHREAVERLSSQALQTQVSLTALRKEGAALEELRGELRDAEVEVRRSLGHAGTLKDELDHVRAVATGLTEDYAAIRDTSRNAREDATAAVTAVREVERKLGPLAELQELSQSTEERLIALNSLAEHVAHKGRALESQQQAVDHAVVQANRVNEMVWSMDAQIARLTEGMKQAARADDTIARVEKLAQDTDKQLETRMKLRQETERETVKLTKEARSVLAAVRGQVDTLTAKKKEFEALDERARALQTSVADGDLRMLAFSAKDRDLIALGERVDGLTKRFEVLFDRSDELTRRQLSLETLHERLAQVDALAKKTSWQMESLRQSRLDLDVLRREVQEFDASRSDVARLSDKLGADRLALEAFVERMAAFSTDAPDLEVQLEAIMGKLKLVEEGTQKAARLHESVAELDGHISRVSARLPLVEQLEGRLNGLNADVDKKLEELRGRRVEVEATTAACDALGAQLADAQYKLEAVRALQGKLVPLVAEVNAVKTEVAAAHDRILKVRLDDQTMAAQEKRFAELVAASQSVATEVAERTRQIQALGAELARTGRMKDELLSELDRVQSRQREAVSQVQASEDQLSRAETMFKQLEQRRTQAAFGEKRLADVESRLAEIKQIAEGLDKSLVSLSGRVKVVNAVKAEIEAVHEISARTKADLAHISEHREDVMTLKARVDELLARIAETDERIAEIDGRRRLVDEVQTKANAIVRLLHDVRLNLETLGEQKTVVDHVAEKVAQLEFTLQEARNTLRMLQHERELIERIAHGIKQLRATGQPEDEKKTA